MMQVGKEINTKYKWKLNERLLGCEKNMKQLRNNEFLKEKS